jgi:TPR repeat protein
VEPDLALAIAWWSHAAAEGSVEAAGALAELRQTALGRGRRGAARRRAAEQAFRDYRATLWAEFPELARDGDDDTVGAALLRQGRGRESVTALLREASALSESAQRLLETLYDRGVEGQVPAHDGRILDYFRTAAEEGQTRPRIALARCYAAGLGVPKDMPRAISLLRATPHVDAQRLLQELLAASEAVTAPTRP